MSFDSGSSGARDSVPTLEACLKRICELERRLEESEDMLDAIRHGAIDAVVVSDAGSSEHRIYTLENADSPYRVLIEQIQEGAVTLGLDGTIFYCNRRLAEMLRMPQERVTGQTLRSFVQPADHGAFEWLLEGAKRGAARGELTVRTSDGTDTPAFLSLSLMKSGGEEPLLCGVLTDLTQQKTHLRELSEANARLVAESAQREAVEEALRQSQKMEAVGQLTGGLAHDFNNLLTGISGSLELLQVRIAQGRINDLERYIITAQGASKRAALLTHRLLAFSRRQTLDPKLTDVNRLVSGMEDLIRRTVGPAIAVEVVAAGGLWTTLVDGPQLENALLNLCLNARDAMPDGGRVTIETGNKWLDQRAAREREMVPGQYVTLCISDTGTGMTPEVIRRAFDPFYTTKPIGMGTGLGLSMVYGFARQSGGQVRIYSEPGQGTLICIYLPRHHGDAEDTEDPAELCEAPHPARNKTVLVVDDEPTVRLLVTEVVESLGYAAIEAGDGPAALKVLQSDARLHLLITDVGLPGGMNGRQVADAAQQIRPDLNVLFITGYAENAVISNGHLKPGMQLLTKPFTMETLATRVNDLIADADADWG